jgi:dTDP-4-amino-4,6-dideoxygalactose transaminase
MIPVTKTFLPPQEQYQAILKEAWDTGWMTNRGVLVKRLEEQLKQYLNVPNIIATTNGTLPLQIAIKALGLTGEIITTPFSYVATTSSIVWEGCTPVYVDIHPDYLTIDETKIEAAINLKTSAILATHVFGNSCNIEVIENIAKKYNLKVIYDAAHCFGVTYKGQSIFNYGDISTCSFHATKLFHTGEGGCWITTNKVLQEQMFFYHNFGHNGPGKFYDVGINAKMSELHAAMGLSVLPYMDHILEERKRVVNSYQEKLSENKLKFLKIRHNTEWNYSYFPIIFENENLLKAVVLKLEANQIFSRRYFFPSLNTLDYLDYNSAPISESISERILCLPLFTDLNEADIKMITSIINSLV